MLVKNKTTIALIYGGKSSEHEVSLLTAHAIMTACNYDRYEILPIYIDINGNWCIGVMNHEPPQGTKELRLQSKQTEQQNAIRINNLGDHVDIAFPVIHGPYGEDGTLQGLLEMFNIPYVGCGVLASAIGIDKVKMKNLFQSVGLAQCRYYGFSRKAYQQHPKEIIQHVEATLGYPCFIKPASLGSSIGISKAKDRAGLVKAVEFACCFDSKIIAEEMVYGRELEIGLLGNQELITSAIGEICSVNEFYDYAAKYKNIGTKLNIPARISKELEETIKEMAIKAFQALDCSGLARIDFFLNEEDNMVLINEVNTMPGFTPYSMYPRLFSEIDISYQELLDRLIQLGFERYEEKRNNNVVVEQLESS